MFKVISTDWDRFDDEAITNFFSSLELKVSETRNEISNSAFKLSNFDPLEETEYCKSHDSIFQDFNVSPCIEPLCKPKSYSPPPPNRISGKWLPGVQDKAYFCQLCERQLGSQNAFSKHLLSEFHLRKSIEANLLTTKSNGQRQCKDKIKSYRDLHCGFAVSRRQLKTNELNSNSETQQNNKCDQGYACPICFSYFETRMSLAKHCLVSHLSKPCSASLLDILSSIVPISPFSCCEFFFNTEKDVENHFKSKYHTQTGEVKCNICKLSINPIDLLDHFKSVEHCSLSGSISTNNITSMFSTLKDGLVDINELTFRNKTINKSTQTENLPGFLGSLKEAVGPNSSQSDITCPKVSKSLAPKFIKEFNCWHCAVKFMSINDLKEHSFKNHEADFIPCDFCCKKLYFMEVKRHMHCCQNYQKKRCFPCKCCNASFICAPSLLLHQSLVHQKPLELMESGHKKLKYICELCKNYYSRSSLLNHFTTHDKDSSYCCSHCPQLFFTNMECMAHEIRYHSHEKHVQPECFTCGKLFSSWGKFHIHAKTHQNARVFLCEICGKSYSSRSNFIAHTDLHKQLLFKCNDVNCTFIAKSKAQLSSHRNLVHRNESSPMCDLCGISFKSTVVLKKHTDRIHKRNNQHKCGECNYTSYSLYHVRRHMRKHTNTKPYRCPHCKYSCKNLVGTFILYHEIINCLTSRVI